MSKSNDLPQEYKTAVKQIFDEISSGLQEKVNEDLIKKQKEIIEKLTNMNYNNIESSIDAFDKKLGEIEENFKSDYGKIISILNAQKRGNKILSFLIIFLLIADIFIKILL